MMGRSSIYYFVCVCVARGLGARRWRMASARGEAGGRGAVVG